MAKILVVDDSMLARNLIKSTFGKTHELLFAKLVSEALNILETQTPDCIISDVNMPEMNGIEFLKAMQDKNLKIPTIMLTGDVTHTTKNECEALGAVAVLKKPVAGQNSEINGWINKILEKKVA